MAISAKPRIAQIKWWLYTISYRTPLSVMETDQKKNISKTKRKLGREFLLRACNLWRNVIIEVKGKERKNKENEEHGIFQQRIVERRINRVFAL